MSLALSNPLPDPVVPEIEVAAVAEAVHVPLTAAPATNVVDPPVADVAGETTSSAASAAVAAIDAAAAQIDWQAAARQAVAQAMHLPPAVRAAFTRSIDDAQATQRDAQGRPLIPLVEAICLVANSLPVQWMQDPSSLQQMPHPQGVGFFDGTEGLSDERAAQIAQQQLAAAGYLRRE